MTEFVTMNEALRDLRVRHARRALAATGGKRVEAAKLLGISRKCLWEALKNAGEDDGVAEGVQTIAKVIAESEGHAIAWHANVRAALGGPEAATKFIRNCFGVDLSGFEWSK